MRNNRSRKLRPHAEVVAPVVLLSRRQAERHLHAQRAQYPLMKEYRVP